MRASVLGLLPARGGSKGLPRKNLLRIAGQSLVGVVASELIKSTFITKAVCSTDSEEIAAEARMSGLHVPFVRPPNLSDDSATSLQVAKHALEFYAANSETFDYLCLVQATSPTVKSSDIDQAIDLAISTDSDTVITAAPVSNDSDEHPAHQFFIAADGRVNWIVENQSLFKLPRQSFPPAFVRTGLVYIIKTELILKRNTFYGDKIVPYLINRDRAISIDTIEDFEQARAYIENQ